MPRPPHSCGCICQNGAAADMRRRLRGCASTHPHLSSPSPSEFSVHKCHNAPRAVENVVLHPAATTVHSNRC
eukprot:366039-Chlamydomonas_euryale.AAC.2